MSTSPSPVLPSTVSRPAQFDVAKLVAPGDTVHAIGSTGSVWSFMYPDEVTTAQFQRDPGPRLIGEPEPPDYVSSTVLMTSTNKEAEAAQPTQLHPTSLIIEGQPISFFGWVVPGGQDMHTSPVIHVIHRNKLVF